MDNDNEDNNNKANDNEDNNDDDSEDEVNTFKYFHIPSGENTVHENKTTSLCCGLWDRAGTAEAERDW